MFGTNTFLAFMYLYYTDYECNYAATIPPEYLHGSKIK